MEKKRRKKRWKLEGNVLREMSRSGGGWEMGNLGNWEWIGSKYIAYIYEVI